MKTVEVYCCRKADLQESKPTDLTIVCNEYSIMIKPMNISIEEEVVFHLDRVTNHPSYNPGTPADIGAELTQRVPMLGGTLQSTT